jgi:hypothetical protein
VKTQKARIIEHAPYKVGVTELQHGLGKLVTLGFRSRDLDKSQEFPDFFRHKGGELRATPRGYYIYMQNLIYLWFDRFLHQCNHISRQSAMAMVPLVGPCGLSTRQALTIGRNEARRPVCKPANKFKS